MSIKPKIEIIAGPNGAGKTTYAEMILKRRRDFNFINADIIAKGLNSSDESAVSIIAGKTMLNIVSEYIDQKENFAFETTLSGKNWIKLISNCKKLGFEIILHYLAIPEVETCKARVAKRVKLGGHNIQDKTIERRYVRSKDMFLQVYKDLVDKWYVIDNSALESRVVAYRDNGKATIIDKDFLLSIFETYDI